MAARNPVLLDTRILIFTHPIVLDHPKPAFRRCVRQSARKRCHCKPEIACGGALADSQYDDSRRSVRRKDQRIREFDIERDQTATLFTAHLDQCAIGRPRKPLLRHAGNIVPAGEERSRAQSPKILIELESHADALTGTSM